MKKIADVPYFNGGKERREEGRQKEQDLQYSTVILRSNIFCRKVKTDCHI